MTAPGSDAMTDLAKPNPGSDAALDMGCTCPVLDNGHGRGDGPFWINGGCPLHDPASPSPPYPFCRTPAECAGKGYCPKETARND